MPITEELKKLYSDRDFLEHCLATACSDRDYEDISEALDELNKRIEELELA